MRIAYLLESTDPHGGVQVVLRQAEALARRGHRVTVVSPDPRPDWFPMSRALFERSAFREARELAGAEVRVATFFRTVEPALEGACGPVFHLCQGYEGGFPHYRAVLSEIERIYGLPTRKLAVSATLSAELGRRGFGPAIDVGQAFDAGAYTPGPPREPADPPVVLVVGPYEAPSKGIAIALEGLGRARARGVRFRLRRAAHAPVSAAERRLGVTDEYHHGIPVERMPEAYRASDAFVAAFREEEGFGLPSLEALACGIPALLSDVPGQREIGGGAVRYFRDGDPESLAEALPGVLTAEARAAARERGPAEAARYDTARVAERLERAFREALTVDSDGGA